MDGVQGHLRQKVRQEATVRYLTGAELVRAPEMWSRFQVPACQGEHRMRYSRMLADLGILRWTGVSSSLPAVEIPSTPPWPWLVNGILETETCFEKKNVAAALNVFVRMTKEFPITKMDTVQVSEPIPTVDLNNMRIRVLRRQAKLHQGGKCCVPDFSRDMRTLQ